jgi:thiosulfate/3-mercaptopyruvate sulfurtransferase
MKKFIVSVQWLFKNLEDPHLVILNASGGVTPQDLQIPNSRIFDLDNVFVDKNSVNDNTYPQPLHFEMECRKIGINNNSKIIVYDSKGIYTSPRAWWLFRLMGHQQVAVLDGGLPVWVDSGNPILPVNNDRFTTGDFTAKFNSHLVRDMDFVVENMQINDAIVIDARSTGRFAGTSPEPREGMSGGHIPGSVNIPFQDVLTNGKLKSVDELKVIFEGKIESQKPLVFSCGSGITACIIMLASEQICDNPKSVYDGSWSEWAISGNPIEKYPTT